MKTFVDIPDVFVTFFLNFLDFCHFFQCSRRFFSVLFSTLFNQLFFSNALKLNKTPKFNESSELIIYFTSEERCMDIWLKETQIADVETF